MKIFRRIVSIGLTLALLAVPVAVFAQRQNIYDWWQLRDYSPPGIVAQLAANTTMNDTGRKLFYVNHPQLDSILNFRADCADSERTIVLGCFRSGKGIYIYNVKDQRLNGVLEVTAAHETLHAAYERLSSKERSHIDQLTAQVYDNLSDARIKATIEQYRDKDPLVVPNEMHSIFGTEVKNLPPELEQYYSRYFSNRSQIVSYSEKYETEFTSRNEKIAGYDKQLTALKSSIETGELQLDSQLEHLKSSRAKLEALLAANKREEYNQQVPLFNTQVANYNLLVRGLQEKIASYNAIVKARNAVAEEIHQLVGAIDTRAETQQLQQ